MISAGERRWHFAVEAHNGNQTDGGQPTYSVDADWAIVKGLAHVPGRFVSVVGGEGPRGRKLEADATGLITLLSTPSTRSLL